VKDLNGKLNLHAYLLSVSNFLKELLRQQITSLSFSAVPGIAGRIRNSNLCSDLKQGKTL